MKPTREIISQFRPKTHSNQNRQFKHDTISTEGIHSQFIGLSFLYLMTGPSELGSTRENLTLSHANKKRADQTTRPRISDQLLCYSLSVEYSV